MFLTGISFSGLFDHMKVLRTLGKFLLTKQTTVLEDMLWYQFFTIDEIKPQEEKHLAQGDKESS